MLDTVEEPIEFSSPGATVGLKKLVLKVLEGFLFRLLNGQSFAQVANVINRLQFRDARW